MRRAFCVFSLICICASLVGCGGDSVNDDAATLKPGEAQAKAAQMPVPPEMQKTSKKH
jgi:hypothetical protein